MRRLLLLAAALLLLPGCLWLRVLDLKEQFADFDRYIEAVEEPALELRFKQPVLLQEDLLELVGARPTVVHEQPDGSALWAFAFTHIPPPVAPELLREPSAHGETMVILATVRDGRLAAIAFPPEIFTVTPKSVAVAALRSLGRAQVDTGNRSAKSEVRMAAGASWRLPTRAGLIGLFGQPNAVLALEGRERLVWRYVLHGASLRPGGRPVVAAMAFAFPPGGEQPVQFLVNVSGLWLYLDLPQPTP